MSDPNDTLHVIESIASNRSLKESLFLLFRPSENDDLQGEIECCSAVAALTTLHIHIFYLIVDRYLHGNKLLPDTRILYHLVNASFSHVLRCYRCSSMKYAQWSLVSPLVAINTTSTNLRF